MVDTRLASIEVTGLFGLYDHFIPLRLGDHITAIIGPNGVGKTVCLKLIESLFSKNFPYFQSVPFEKITYNFSTGEVVIITQSARHEKDRSGSEEATPGTTVRFKRQNGATSEWTPISVDKNSPLRRNVERYLSFLNQIGPDTWWDTRTGATFGFDDLLSRYSQHLPSVVIKQLKGAEPNDFSTFIGKISCRLIETQRLISRDYEGEDERHLVLHARMRSREPKDGLTVDRKAEKLKSILQSTLTEYAALSQSLDRTFPKRVLDSDRQGHFYYDVGESVLRKQLEELDKRRLSLMAAGILAEEVEPVNLVGEINSGVARVLEIYVQDTTVKLEVFAELARKLEVFKRLIDSRFGDKRITIDRNAGFKIFSRTDREIPLEKLSSGEQHQLILAFELLFEVSKNSLILIDEPELSLHVGWQRTFIDSLLEIIELNRFDIVVATHSPTLVSRHIDLSVVLGQTG